MPSNNASQPPGFAEEHQAALEGAPNFVSVFAKAVADAGITEKDWKYFDHSLNDVRMARYDRIHKEPLFGDWYDDVEES